VVGSSLGASLAQLAALREPGSFSSLILVDGGLLARTRLHPALLLMLLPMFGERRYRDLRHAPEAAYASLSPYYASLEGLPAEEQEFLRERVLERVASDTQMRAYFSFFRGYFGWMLLNGKACGGRAQRLGVETLYIWGAEDHIIPLGAGQGAMARHPGARLAIIPAAGHLPHQEAPDDFLRLLT
jgi:pimeloyl-ACP methyl ester carboxylesterase